MARIFTRSALYPAQASFDVSGYARIPLDIYPRYARRPMVASVVVPLLGSPWVQFSPRDLEANGFGLADEIAQIAADFYIRYEWREELEHVRSRLELRFINDGIKEA